MIGQLQRNCSIKDWEDSRSPLKICLLARLPTFCVIAIAAGRNKQNQNDHLMWIFFFSSLFVLDVDMLIFLFLQHGHNTIKRINKTNYWVVASLRSLLVAILFLFALTWHVQLRWNYDVKNRIYKMTLQCELPERWDILFKINPPEVWYTHSLHIPW